VGTKGIGLPQAIISDQDPLFMAKEFQKWLQDKGIEHKASSPYHPQTDGQSERKNKSIIPMFVMEESQGNNWVKVAPKVQTQVNARISGPRGKTPFQALYGFNPKLAAAQLPHPIPIYSDPTQEYYKVAENLTKAKKQQLEQANKNRRPAPEYQVGDQVLLSTQNLTPYSKETKLHYKWIGPFPITKVNKWKQSYHLDLSEYPELARITSIFYTNLLKAYIPNDKTKFPSR